MDREDDPRELERKIAQASRIASSVSDQTTVGRLLAWAEDLRRKLQQHREARRTKEEIRTRARELWEQSGRPEGRDVEFWLQAESEISERNQE
jgi:predicted RNA-binding Zn ribbon-like protein